MKYLHLRQSSSTKPAISFGCSSTCRYIYFLFFNFLVDTVHTWMFSYTSCHCPGSFNDSVRLISINLNKGKWNARQFDRRPYHDYHIRFLILEYKARNKLDFPFQCFRTLNRILNGNLEGSMAILIKHAISGKFRNIQ